MRAVLTLATAASLTVVAPAGAFELEAADYALLKAINQAHHPVADAAMIGLSNEVQLVATPLIAGYGLSGSWQAPARIFGAGLASGLAMTGAKMAFGRPRPYVTHPDLRTPRGGAPMASFPSGHAAISFAGATAIAQLYPQWAVPAYAWAGAVSYSRMYLGEHYPTDVLAGAALGVGSALAAGWAMDRAFGPMPAPAVVQLPVGFRSTF